MAARFATASYWYHSASTGHDRFVELGATRDSVTDAEAIAANPSLWQASPVANLPPKVSALLAARPRGWEFV
jgi:hypothetical protein